MDRVNMIYSIIIIFAFYNFIVFGILWYKEKYMPVLYAYVTFLVFGIGLSRGVELYSRLMKIDDPERFLLFLNSDLWFERLWVEMVCLLLVCVHITWRLFVWGSPINKNRRKTDNQKEVMK